MPDRRKMPSNITDLEDPRLLILPKVNAMKAIDPNVIFENSNNSGFIPEFSVIPKLGHGG